MDKHWEDWFQHQHTWRLLQQYRPQRRAALKDLIKLCEDSSDPRVSAHVEKYKALCATVSMLTGSQKGADEDEEQ
jgi:hypothetical protein